MKQLVLAALAMSGCVHQKTSVKKAAEPVVVKVAPAAALNEATPQPAAQAVFMMRPVSNGMSFSMPR